LAEELAHILIHADALRKMSPEELERFNDLMTAGQYRRYEHDAKYLASCLLMRKSAFVERFNSHCAIQEKRVSNRSKVLRYAMRQLGMDFCVPPAAASQRAFRLRLITEGQFTELGYFPA
jgi:Zn-dependent peptidase ImmA (M78 family)